MQPLYKISQEYLKAYHELATDENIPEEAIKDTLEGIQGEFEQKAINIAAFIKNLEAMGNAIKDAEEKMKERRKSIENKIDRLKEYLLQNMEYLKLSKIPSPEFDIKTRLNTAFVYIADDVELPEEYIRITVKKEPDKIKLKEALTNGISINGVSLKQNKSLIIL